MVAKNNMLPRGTGKKHWRFWIKTHFDIPMKRMKRKVARRRKAARQFPRPLELLHPVVRCCQSRFSMRLRKGKGFTVAELKSVGMKPQYARTVGITVDLRRKNKNEEEFQRNVQVLKNYLKGLVILPKDPKKKVNEMTMKQIIEKAPQRTSRAGVPTQEIDTSKVVFREITEKDIKQKLPTKRLLNERKRKAHASYVIQSAKRNALKKGKKGKKKKKKKKGKK